MPTEPAPVSPVTSDGAPRSPIAVLLVDDHPAVRAGARMLLDDQPDIAVVAEARGAEEALAQPEPQVDVAVVDYHLDDGHDGLWLTTELRRMDKPPHVLIYSTFADNALAVRALIAGADGLLDKRGLGQELCSAIRRLARGQRYLPAISSPLAHALRSRLVPLDQSIYGMLLHGIAPDVIAERLGITGDELAARRSSMLKALKPARGRPALPPTANGPLDYERVRRAAGRRAA